MSEALRETMLEMMVTLCTRIAASTSSAEELMRSAALLNGQLASNAMRDIVRRQRVKILEMEGQLAALNVAFERRFGTEP